MAFVHFDDAPDAQLVPIQHLHRFYLKELIMFYESNVVIPGSPAQAAVGVNHSCDKCE
jgi:hypothetical protein